MWGDTYRASLIFLIISISNENWKFWFWFRAGNLEGIGKFGVVELPVFDDSEGGVDVESMC